MTTVESNGVTLGVEHFGDASAPLVLLAGGTTMLSWPDALCEALARGRRHVVRYDLRDCGVSTTVNPRPRRTRCAISQPTPRRWPASSMTGPRTWRASAWAEWSPRSPRSITRTCSRR
jgi:pimeloyl-ACP methyl ester carboxylesterase